MMTATKTRKTARQTERSATLGTMTNGKLILWLTQDGDTRGYVLTPIPSDFGAAYQLQKADNGDGHSEEYDVLLNGRESSCTCKGNTYRSHCKHVDALEALIRAGKLAILTAKPQPATEPLELDDLSPPRTRGEQRQLSHGGNRHDLFHRRSDRARDR